MAFQTPSAIANMALIGSEAWPSMKSSLDLSWRNFRYPTIRFKPRRLTIFRKRYISNIAPKNKAPVLVELPDCLASMPLASLRSLRSLRYGGNLMNSKAFGISSMPPSEILLSANPFSHARPTTQAIRSYSTHPMSILAGSKRIIDLAFSGSIKGRDFAAGTSSQNLLSHMEQTANNNPTSPTAQNAFYSALLRADMPAIIIERYQTGRFATNSAVDTTYKRALERLAQTNVGSNTQAQGQNSFLNHEQLQAVGQAIAASSQGGNIGVVRGKSSPNGTGAKNSPLYVVVEESIGTTLFKWVKFIFYFALIAYLVLIVFSFAVEATGVIKKVGGTQNNEAQPQHQTVRFSDVHGCDEAKEELQELVEFLKAPAKFSTLGGKLPKGVLLVGPPGTGKTLLARAVAGESGVPFFFMSGAEFDEIYVGVGAKRVRDLFSNARAKAPAIIFIDELDAIGGKRNERDPAYVKQSLNQLLTELDGFSQETGVIILAATNFPQLLDKALTRPGRFDRKVVVPLPDVRGRVDILKHHMKNVQIAAEVDETVIARGTPGFSGAELENLVNQAAVRASRNKSEKVGVADFDWAKDKIIMGAERRSAVIQEKDKIMTAYHEGGHALVALSNPSATPVYKATIMPRGQSLGMTMSLQEMDKVSMTKKEYLAQIDVCMGGKVAEELVYGADSVSSGCASDLQQATTMAFAMVTQMGMSEHFGSIDLYSEYNRLSSETKQQIENEVRRILEESHQRATKVLTERRGDLDVLAKALVDYEVLTADEMKRVIKGERLPKLTTLPNVPIKLPEIVLPRSGSGGGIGGGSGGLGVPVVGNTEPEESGGAKL